MAGEGVGLRYLMTPKAGPDGTPRKRCGFCPSRTMIVFTVNLLLGLVIGQTVGSSASSGDGGASGARHGYARRRRRIGARPASSDGAATAGGAARTTA